MKIDSDTALGVSITLSYILESGWQHTLDGGGFIVTPPLALQTHPDLSNLLHTQAWKISSGLAYWHFASLRETADGGFRLDTKMKSGAGYYVIFAPK
jgi:hypothetical protein